MTPKQTLPLVSGTPMNEANGSTTSLFLTKRASDGASPVRSDWLCAAIQPISPSPTRNSAAALPGWSGSPKRHFAISRERAASNKRTLARGAPRIAAAQSTVCCSCSSSASVCDSSRASAAMRATSSLMRTQPDCTSATSRSL